MPLTTIRSPPSVDTFTSLADHQSQTPSSFYSAKPVLHYHVAGARALISEHQASKLPISSPADTSAQHGTGNDTPIEAQSFRTVVVDIYVSSENFTLYNPTSSIGVSIPYPTISLHAIQRLPDPANAAQEVQGLYMHLELSGETTDYANDDDDEEPETVELTLLPPSPAAIADETSTPSADPTKDLFDAVSACSNLHPDPINAQDGDDDEDMLDVSDRIVFERSEGYEDISGLPGVSHGMSDGGLPPPFPGSSGWITAENVGEYFDAEGNWIGGGDEEPLGEGAGRVRVRGELEGDDGEDRTERGPRLNGDGKADGDEHKRLRTD